MWIMKDFMLKNVDEFENDEQLLKYLYDTDTEKEYMCLYDVVFKILVQDHMIGRDDWCMTCSFGYNDYMFTIKYYRQGKRKVYQGGVKVSVREAYAKLYNCWKELGGKRTPLEILERVVSLSDYWDLEQSNDGYYRRISK